MWEPKLEHSRAYAVLILSQDPSVYKLQRVESFFVELSGIKNRIFLFQPLIFSCIFGWQLLVKSINFGLNFRIRNSESYDSLQGYLIFFFYLPLINSTVYFHISSLSYWVDKTASYMKVSHITIIVVIAVFLFLSFFFCNLLSFQEVEGVVWCLFGAVFLHS